MFSFTCDLSLRDNDPVLDKVLKAVRVCFCYLHWDEASFHPSIVTTSGTTKESKDIRPSFCPPPTIETHHTRTRGPENPSNPLCSEFFSSLLERAVPIVICLRSGGQKGWSLERNFGFFSYFYGLFPDHRYNLREKLSFFTCRYLLVRIWRGKVN